jgi:hypothetical protein
MAKKGKAKNIREKQDGVWLSPKYSLTTGAKTPKFDTNMPAANRLLELADTSLHPLGNKDKEI